MVANIKRLRPGEYNGCKVQKIINHPCGQPYIGIVEGKSIHHPGLLTGKRARMKILLPDAGRDLPVKKINVILKDVLALYR